MTRRRGRGEGSITQRADGRWMARVELDWQDGRRRRKAIYGRTRRAVADALRDASTAAQRGTLVGDERQTVGQFLARWLQDVARTRVRPRTLAGYEATIERHISPQLGRVRLAKLTPQYLTHWLGILEIQGASAGRRCYARAILRTALNTAIRWRLVVVNAATLVDAPRTAPREIRPLTPDEAKRLLMVAKGHPLAAFIAVALGCGLRLGEALGLQWTDVDLDTGTLQVRRAVQRFGGDRTKRRTLLGERKGLLKALREARAARQPATTRAPIEAELRRVRQALHEVRTVVQFTEPKSVRSRRTIALPAMVIAALRGHRVNQLEARLAAGGDWQDGAVVFASSVGTPLDPRNVTREFKALLTKAALPDIRFHDLRHSAATLLLIQGVSPRVVMETLGHSQISLTMNTYSHVLPALQRDAAVKMNAILTSG